MSSDPSFALLLTNIGTSSIFIIILIVLLFMSSMCSATETAYSSLNIIRVKQMTLSGSKTHRKRARRVYSLVKNYSKVLNTILVVNNIVNLAASSIVTYIFVDTLKLGETAVLIATAISSIAIIIFGEIVPKNLAKLYPQKFATFISFPLLICTYIFLPVTFFFTKLNSKFEEKLEEDEDNVTATETELEEIVETIEREGVLEHNESELIKSAMHFDDISVRTIMVEKENVLFIEEGASFNEIVKTITLNKYTRMPYIDKEGKVLGIINEKDVFELITNRKLTEEEKIKSIVKEPIYISYRRLLPYALEKIQRSAEHMVIVVDNLKEKNYLGIITLEDILEELIGEIYDEHDDIPKDLLEIGHHIFQISGSYDLEDLFDEYLDDTQAPKGKYKSVGSWVKSLFNNEKIKEESSIEYENLEIKVLEIDEDKQIIKKVEIIENTNYEEEE
mgnify:CR=1 FL=1